MIYTHDVIVTVLAEEPLTSLLLSDIGAVLVKETTRAVIANGNEIRSIAVTMNGADKSE